MPYDAAFGRSKPPSLTLASAADAPWKAERLAAFTAGAALLIVVWHLMDIALAPVLPGASHGGARPLPAQAANAGGALLAAILGFRAYRRPGLWIAAGVLAWSVLECFPGLTLAAYRHAALPRLAPLGVLMALAGLRGAVALRRFEKTGDYVPRADRPARTKPLLL